MNDEWPAGIIRLSASCPHRNRNNNRFSALPIGAAPLDCSGVRSTAAFALHAWVESTFAISNHGELQFYILIHSYSIALFSKRGLNTFLSIIHSLHTLWIFLSPRQSSKSISKPAPSSRKKKPLGSKKSAPIELTEDQKQEIREAFDLFDTDGSGTM